MIGDLKVGVLIAALNEADRLPGIVAGIPRDSVDMVVVVNDGSTDGTGDVARELERRGFVQAVIDKPVNEGPGPAVRDALRVLHRLGADVAVPVAANGKTDPAQVPELVRPIAEEGYELVRGSRHLSGGGQVNMPGHRLWLTRLFTALMSLLIGQRITDGTGGFQAYRLTVLDDERIDLWQPWLGRYEVETYLFVKMLQLGYRWKEIPVRITYPQRGDTYTKARPFVDWWGYFRPIPLLAFRLKR